jgi:DEAD/DEAH box helicase domain-containing protein
LLSLPEQEMHTTAFWLHFSSTFFNNFRDFSTAELQDALRALGNALQTAGTVLLLSDPRDLAVAVLDDSAEKKTVFEPDVVLYDNYPGGIGQSDPLFRRSEQLVAAALELAESCACEAGCPSCVGPYTEIGQRGKEGAVRILRQILAS